MKNIGIIGVGGIANNVHITQLLTLPDAKIVAVCDTDPAALARAKERLSLSDEHLFSNYKDLIDLPEIDAVEICTPNYMHVEMARYALSKGKSVNVEKPLGISLEECLDLKDCAKDKDAVAMMSMSYRFMPAVRYAKSIIDDGLLGDIVGINVEYLKSSALWAGRRLEWRFVKKYAGTGVLGDLGVHLIDMASLLVGDFLRVGANAGIVVKERQYLDSEDWGPVETDDYCNFVATLSDRRTGKEVGASFTITRCALGNANTIKYDIFGTDGVISFNLNDPTEIAVCVGKVDRETESLHTVKVPQKYFITQEEAFVNALHGKKCDFFPTVDDGIACQRVLDALERSATEGKFVSI